MDEKEKEVQRALGTLAYYIVMLKITCRDVPPYIRAEVVEAGNEKEAFEEAVQAYTKDNNTVRRDQITLVRCHKYIRLS